jgi:manganese/zinc/iron transport system permease protein
MFSNSPFFNPYHEITFGNFFIEFLYRMGALLTGQLSFNQLVADEIQIFVLVAIAASSALVGAFLILRRMTMLANALSHTLLMGIVLAYVIWLALHQQDGHEHGSSFIPMQYLLGAALIMGFITSFLTEFLTKTVLLQADASTGIVFTSLFALGVILVTILTRSAHIGMEAVMGNADALHLDDIKWVSLILLGNVVLFSLFFKEFTITTFDPGLAYALGFSNTFFNYLLMAQVSATTIGAFRAVGVFLVLAFITGPALIARLLTHDLKKLLCLSVCLGALASLVGVALTRHILTVFGVALSTSGMVVCVITLLYGLAILFAPETGIVARWWHHKNILKKEINNLDSH